MKNGLPNGAMLNAYPDSIGERLTDAVAFLQRPELRNAFTQFYVLPTMFNSDLDRGFSVIDYDLNDELVSRADLDQLDTLGIALKVDLVVNHLSVGSPQFRDLIANGDASDYRDFFIDWNEFWDGHGEVADDGHVVPTAEHLSKLFMRKPELPILAIRFPDGSDRFYWNTFYQRVDETPAGRRYLGQMDLNAESEMVWDFYADTIEKLAGYGVRILRLDAFAYLHKQVGERNFFNRPGTWQHLERLRALADRHGLVLLPEIHAEYGSLLHEELSDQGYPIYDFFFPGLVIDALDSGCNRHLLRWIDEIIDRDLHVVNMLGCHDGIPAIDLRGGTTVDGRTNPGILTDDEIEALVERLLDRGGRVKNLYGADGTKVAYYQVNATFFSALGENEDRMLLARALQMFMPGTPQVWYLDLFAGVNDLAAADAAGEGGHKEINRTNLSVDDIEAGLQRAVVTDQIELLRLRNTSPAFAGSLEIGATEENELLLTWRNGADWATLEADLATGRFSLSHSPVPHSTTTTS